MGSSGVRLAPPQRRRQLLALVALSCGVVYLGWRYGFTLRPGLLWLGVPLILAETWALVAVALFVFSTWRLTVREPGPSIPGVAVAVLVPTFNEPPEILRATVLGALAVRHDPTPEVWVLDDGHRIWAKAMAEELGARYLVRPAPQRHAKAGNLNHALQSIDADYLLVLDADHVPFPQFLERTLGYFSDPEVAFVQSPQAFFNRSFQHPRSTDDPIRNEQSLFYEVICPGKDRDNAVFWCGSSAVLRRQALVSIGGVATDTVVEDTHTAMKLHQAGWKSVYHAEVLAVGLAPEEVRAFLTQRGRWARGCYQILRRDNPLWAKGLTLRQRLHYFSSVSHYLEGPQRLVSSVVPSLVLLTGTIPLSANPWLYLSLFLPQVILVPSATAAMARGRYRFVESDRFALVRMGAYSAAAAALLNHEVTFKVTPKGSGSTGDAPLKAVWLQLGVAALALTGVAYQTAAQLADLPGRLSLFAYAVTVFWTITGAGLIGATVLWASRIRHRRNLHRFPVSIHVRYSTSPNTLELKRAPAFDLNPSGLGIETPEQLTVGQQLELSFQLGTSHITTNAVVASVVKRPGRLRVGLRFEGLSKSAQDLISRWCFSHPFGPEHSIGNTKPDLQAADPLQRTA